MGIKSVIGRRNLFCYGTRPSAIKLAPVINATIDKVIICTGQHDDLLDTTIVKSDRNLNLLKLKQAANLNTIGYDLIRELSWVFKVYKPQRVVVLGDTATAYYATLVAFNMNIDVAHVEAGLRTWDIKQPFPEESYRQGISTMANLHFAPTKQAAENLLKTGNLTPDGESYKKCDIHITGNPIVDSVLKTAPKPSASRNIVITLHRRESNVSDYGRALHTIITAFPTYNFRLFVHPNSTGQHLARILTYDRPKNLELLEPVSYVTFLNELASCYMILTDSGGLQEEAATLGKPVIILRKLTERPEVLSGVGRLAPTGEQAVRLANEIIDNSALYKIIAEKPNPFGSPGVGERIADVLND